MTTILTIIGGMLTVVTIVLKYILSPKYRKIKILNKINKLEKDYNENKKKRQESLPDSVDFYYFDYQCKQLSKEIYSLRIRLEKSS